MALLFCDSFETYTTISQKYPLQTGGSISSSGRFSKGYLCSSAGTGAARSLNGNYSTLIAGFAFFYSTISLGQLVGFYDWPTCQTTIWLTNTGALEVRRGNSTILGTTAVGVVPINVWKYIQFKATIHSSTGTIDLLVDGVSVLSLTGQDTNATANNYANAFNLGGESGIGSPNTGIISDLVILDTSGSINNTYLGDVRVQSMLPSGAGNYAQFTPSAGSNYQNVDDAAPNGDTDYNSSATVNQIDSFAMTDVTPTSGSVKGVMWTAYARKDDAGTRTIAPFIRSSATDAVGSDKTLSTSYAYYEHVFEQNPVGPAAWTIASVNSVEAGYKLTA